MMHVGNRMKFVGLSYVQKLKADGCKLLALAPTAKAAAILQQAGIPAITHKMAWSSKQAWSDVDANTVIIIDESYLMSLI